MEEKESTVSASLGNSDTDSPPAPVSSMVVTQMMGMDINMMGVNMEMERTGLDDAGAAAAAAAAAVAVIPTATPGSGGGSQGTGGGGATSVNSLGKKKRGRPRKYDSEGNLRPPYNQIAPSPPGFSFSPSPPPEYPSKRGRGRPAGTGNSQLLASLGEMFANTAVWDFTPHVVTVLAGEDVAEKIVSFSLKGPRGICVLSANGSVSNVTLRQPGSSSGGGILTYEGRFEILALTGSFTVNESGGHRSRTGALSVSLAGPDGRVVGGAVAGSLLAASPIQIVIGSFMQNGYKTNKRKNRENTTASPTMVSPTMPAAPETVTAARPFSEAKPADGEICLTTASSLLGQGLGDADNNANNKQTASTVPSHNAGWNGSEPTSIHRPSPDINLSVPSE